MANLVDYVLDISHRLLHQNPDKTVRDLQITLRRLLGVDALDIDIDAATPLEEFVKHPFRVSMAAVHDVPNGTDELPGSETFARPEVEHRARHVHQEGNGVAERRAQPLSMKEVFRRFITELSRLEQRRDFMWVGFVRDTLIPNLGVHPSQAQRVLDALLNEQVVALVKRANPKNPDHPSTGVQLNRDHALVRELAEPVRGDNGPGVRSSEVRGGDPRSPLGVAESDDEAGF